MLIGGELNYSNHWEFVNLMPTNLPNDHEYQRRRLR